MVLKAQSTSRKNKTILRWIFWIHAILMMKASVKNVLSALNFEMSTVPEDNKAYSSNGIGSSN
ncbi:hypothetical protein HMPREF1982_00012 [Clostridiales bacterium oral taxon 876 str. F0540]|nr:hypothetical protein HMPREF1982_00012 [Clostridiales bacterium oral taxon 876 str. F0540]